MKPMLPIYNDSAPQGSQWVYEPKYDGFRAILTINENNIEMASRNGSELITIFPEIKDYLESIKEDLKPYLPLGLDGELVWLENPYKSNFQHVQWRGRLRTGKTISEQAVLSPACFMAFDLLLCKGADYTKKPYKDRREALQKLFRSLSIPLEPSPVNSARLQCVPASSDYSKMAHDIVLFDGEGIVAKSVNSIWEQGSRTPQWQKIKNWHTVHCFITALNKENGYLSLGVFENGSVVSIGQVKNGINAHIRNALTEIIKQNAVSEDAQYLYIHPSICIAVNFLHVYEEKELREPQFKELLMNTRVDECTYMRFLESQFTFPEKIKITSPDKPIWELDGSRITKIEYLQYLRQVSSRFLLYLKDHTLTTIRYPHGTFENDRFYQKQCPDYAPSFVQTFLEDDINYILCNDMETLIWLGNQLALEFHIPFQKAGITKPDEIVLDLDPPSTDKFYLAVKAAIEIKKILDSIQMTAFLKTSGNRGLQIHIPLPYDMYSYHETRIFTDFLANYILNNNSEDFTIERMKKNRGGRLYLDFVQHSEGKTIIAPYAARGNSFAGIAAPLYWDELDQNLDIRDFNVITTPRRLLRLGCPFQQYEASRNSQPFQEVIDFLKKKGK
ncbi:DNA ligase D [Peribacillus sp. SCS-155]|uniref:DNA ligase D n=1 Tax=Peribacillus sedimenti TaxID=3115297 RepID=UPI003905CD25